MGTGDEVSSLSDRHLYPALWNQSTDSDSVVPEKLEAPRILCWEKERLKSLVSAKGETLLWEETSDKLGDPLTGETGADMT